MYFGTIIMSLMFLYGYTFEETESAAAAAAPAPAVGADPVELHSCSPSCLPCSLLGCCNPLAANQQQDEDSHHPLFTISIRSFEIKFLTANDASQAASKIIQDGKHRQYLTVNIVRSSPVFGSKNTVEVHTDDSHFFDPNIKIDTDADRPENLWVQDALGDNDFTKVFSIKYHSYRMPYH